MHRSRPKFVVVTVDVTVDVNVLVADDDWVLVSVVVSVDVPVFDKEVVAVDDTVVVIVVRSQLLKAPTEKSSKTLFRLVAATEQVALTKKPLKEHPNSPVVSPVTATC